MKKYEKILVFDMDGTIADLYGNENWLEDLKNYNPRPYQIAAPIYDMTLLNSILVALKQLGWTVIVTSWLSKESTNEYDKLVRQAKKEWLDRYEFPYDELHIVKYGTPKADCTRKKGENQILIDDNPKVRKSWRLGNTLDASENILPFLINLLDRGVTSCYNK